VLEARRGSKAHPELRVFPASGVDLAGLETEGGLVPVVPLVGMVLVVPEGALERLATSTAIGHITLIDARTSLVAPPFACDAPSMFDPLVTVVPTTVYDALVVQCG